MRLQAEFNVEGQILLTGAGFPNCGLSFTLTCVLTWLHIATGLELMLWLSVFFPDWREQANLCFVDIDNHCVDAPEDLPVFPDQSELTQELSEVLLRFGLSPRSGGPRSKTDSAASPQLTSLVLEDLMEDRRNGNLGGEELAVLERLQALALRCGGRNVSDEGKTLKRALEEEEEELKAARLNVQLREVFAGRFAAMFNRYEEFIVHGALDLDSWLSNREGTSSFDKVHKTMTLPRWLC